MKKETPLLVAVALYLPFFSAVASSITLENVEENIAITSFDISSYGDNDWAYWSDTSGTPTNSRAGCDLISDATVVGTGTLRAATSSIKAKMTYADGSMPASGQDVVVNGILSDDLATAGAGVKFYVELPTTSEYQLYLWTAAYRNENFMIKITLPGSSVFTVNQSTNPHGSLETDFYTFRLQADSASDVAVVELINLDSYGAYVHARLGACALSTVTESNSDVTCLMGGGNFIGGMADGNAEKYLDVLAETEYSMVRINLYPGRYLTNYGDPSGSPTPESLDSTMVEFSSAGIENVLLLIEYYGDYTQYSAIDEYDWYSIGYAFAERFKPNSAWLQSQGIYNKGIKYYQMANEPDHLASIPLQDYADAIEAFANGVHAAYPNAKVMPGAYMAENAWSIHDCKGYASVLAPLFNNGTLAGLDLHTYNDLSWANIHMWDWSPQRDFEQVKSASGITADIQFFASEFNVKTNPSHKYQGETLDEETASKYSLTSIFGNLCVRKNDGSPATGFALIWAMFHQSSNDTNYGLLTTLDPPVFNMKGEVWQMVSELLKDMSISSIDTPDFGIHTFLHADNDSKLWVKQNLTNWCNQVSSSWTLYDVPATATELKVYYYDGQASTVNTYGSTTVTLNGLRTGETVLVKSN